MTDQPVITPTPSRAGRRLRVCMVAYTFYESDNRVMRYAETLAGEGHHVEVFVMCDLRQLLCVCAVSKQVNRMIAIGEKVDAAV